MIKIHQYIDPLNDSIWCITVECFDADNKWHFRSETDPDVIAYLMQNNYIEEIKENAGMNVCIITVTESPS